MNQNFERVNVRDFGAKGDGITNDAPAIQAAINSVADIGGVVYLPAGVYRMCEGVLIPFGVNVEGITTATTGPWQNHLDTADKKLPSREDINPKVPAGDGWINPKLFKGTWVICDHDFGNPQGDPTFRMEGNTSISRIGFVNRSMPPVSEKAIPCPPCIAHYSTHDLPYTRDGVTVEDISLANPYYGIALAADTDLESSHSDLEGPHKISVSCGRHRIHNIMGAPLYRGIVLKNLLDTVDIHNCQFNYSCYEPNHVYERSVNATDIYFSRGDGMNMSNILSFGARHALMTTPSFPNNMGACSFRLTNVNFEGIEPIALYAPLMYEISNSYFLTTHPMRRGADIDACAVQIKYPEKCEHNPFITFSNCVFQNSCSNGHFIDVDMTAGCNPVFTSCQFWGWREDIPMIHLHKRDNEPGSLTISTSVFIGNRGAHALPSEMPGTLAKADGEGYHDGELRFVSCRIPESILDQTSLDGIWYDNCVVYNDESQNRRFQS